MAKQFPLIHKDFAHFPAFNFPFYRPVIGLLNTYLHIDTFFHQQATKARARKHRVTSSDGIQIPVFQFNPDKSTDKRLPALIYCHGGAFVLTYASTHVQAMNYYANKVGCSVFMVDYRLAPASPFPKGFNDCCDSLQWLMQNAESLGVDPTRIAVGGDSAGGALAAGVAQKALDEALAGNWASDGIVGQMLIYPVLDQTCSTQSAKEFEHTPMFNSATNRKMWKLYLKHCDRAEPPSYASPADHSRLSNLPRAYIENAEFDPLRDEASIYAGRLQKAGVKTELIETKGTVHGYDTVLDSHITKNSFEKRVAFLKDVFDA